jgi:insertion element IS1 protein InsB
MWNVQPADADQRLVRRTICFSNTTTMHDLVISLFINRYEFGVVI